MKHAFLFLMLLATPLSAHDLKTGELHIIHPSIPSPMAVAKSAAGYMTISNEGDTAEELIAVRTPFASSSTLHTTIFEDGIAKMRPLAGLPIAPGEVVNLEPGGMHVMFMGLSGPAYEGDMIPSTLVFRKAGDVEIKFMVDAAGAADHSTADHSGH